MAVKEMNALIQMKDKNGDINIIYPITKSENVDGDTIPEGVVSYTGEVSYSDYPTEVEGVIHTNDTIIYPVTKASSVIDEDGRSMEDIMGQNAVQVSATISAENWTGTEAPYTNTVSVEGVTETNVVDLITPEALTQQQIEAYQNSLILNATQSSGQITLQCWGTPPTIDLPMLVNIRGTSIKTLQIDTELSETSLNSVSNKAVTMAINQILQTLDSKDNKKTEFTETLSAGDTSVVITNSQITENIILSVYTNKFGVNPTNVEIVDNTATITFLEQETDIQVKVVIE